MISKRRAVFFLKPILFIICCRLGFVQSWNLLARGVTENALMAPNFSQHQKGLVDRIIMRVNGTTATTVDPFPYGARVAFFAGQGFLAVGMGVETANKGIPIVDTMYTRASEILGSDLRHVMANGPLSMLTEIAQPAILVASLAAVERLKFEKGQSAIDKFRVAVGFSLGEYAALSFAGVLSFEDAVRLTSVRGAAMKRAAALSPQKMISVDGPPTAIVEAVCKEVSDNSTTGNRVQIANYLAETLNVISGDSSACVQAAEIIKERYSAQLRRITPLSVIGAFHTDFMRPAEEALKEALYSVPFSDAIVPVMSNVDGQPRTNGEEIRALLLKQLTSPVRMHSILNLLLTNGVREGVEFGPTSGLGAMMKRVANNRPNEKIAQLEITSML